MTEICDKIWVMETMFLKWLQDEMDDRGWTYAEFARRADITPSMVSLVMDNKRGIGRKFLLGTARALNMPKEMIFRRAGVEDRERTVDQMAPGIDWNDFQNAVRQLSIEERINVFQYVMWRYSMRPKSQGTPDTQT